MPVLLVWIKIKNSPLVSRGIFDSYHAKTYLFCVSDDSPWTSAGTSGVFTSGCAGASVAGAAAGGTCPGISC